MSNTNLKEALGHVRPEWDDVRAENALSGLERKRRRRTVVRASTATALSIAAVAIVVLALPTEQASDPAQQAVRLAVQPAAELLEPEAAPIPEGAFRLPDGTSGVPANDASRLTVIAATDDLVEVRVDAGRCDFEVTPGRDRVFRAQAGQVTVTVLGTAFSVGLDGEQTHVQVARGKVRVEWPGGIDELEAGSQGLYPPPIIDETPDAGQLVAQKKTVKRRSPGARADWRQHARNGEFDEAAAALRQAKDVRDTVEDLLLAADAMRLSGHPARALPYLEKVMKNHRSDPRAPLAEFTRGRVLLLQLGQPRPAAKAFRSVRQLAPRGNLAQDALAREVEAWHRAGEAGKARQLAEQYVSQYPSGRRLRAVRRFGGLD